MGEHPPEGQDDHKSDDRQRCANDDELGGSAEYPGGQLIRSPFPTPALGHFPESPRCAN